MLNDEENNKIEDEGCRSLVLKNEWKKLRELELSSDINRQAKTELGREDANLFRKSNGKICKYCY